MIAVSTWKRGKILIKEGDIGGYCQGEHNVPNDTTDNSWVAHNAMIFDDAILINSIIMNTSSVFNSAKLNNSMIQDTSKVFGNAQLIDSQCHGNSDVYGNAILKFTICRDAVKISGNAQLTDCKLWQGAYVTDDVTAINCQFYDQSRAYGRCRLDNCNFKSATLVRDADLKNETLSRDIQLNVIAPSVSQNF